jgi:hypothetical protein
MFYKIKKMLTCSNVERCLLYILPAGIINIFYFFSSVWRYRTHDYCYSLILLKKSLSGLKKGISNGNEVEITRMKKERKIGRCIEILDNIITDNYINIAEDRLGYKYKDDNFLNRKSEESEKKNKNIYTLSTKIENNELDELFSIMKGQNQDHFIMIRDRGEKLNLWENWYDGTGIRSWGSKYNP